MFCSTIIPTIGRPELSRAVNSVLSQEFTADEFEIIVVNDSDKPLDQADWQQSERVQLFHTKQHERSIARNTGAAIARGRYLHFLDDDDWLLPNALENLWHLANSSDAVWLYGGTQLVDRNGKSIIKLHQGISGNGFIQVLAGEHIHLQASLIEAVTFFAVGGFNPLLAGPEGLARLEAKAGGELALGEVAELAKDNHADLLLDALFLGKREGFSARSREHEDAVFDLNVDVERDLHGHSLSRGRIDDLDRCGSLPRCIRRYGTRSRTGSREE